MDFKKTKSQLIWIILAMSIMATYFAFWIQFGLILVLLIGVVSSLAIVFVLGKVFSGYSWKIPIVTCGLYLLYHLYSVIFIYYHYYSNTIYHMSFLQAFQYNVGGENGLVIWWLELPFIILTILITIGFIIYGKVKVEMDIVD